MLDMKVEHWKRWGVREVIRQILLEDSAKKNKASAQRENKAVRGVTGTATRVVTEADDGEVKESDGGCNDNEEEEEEKSLTMMECSDDLLDDDTDGEYVPPERGEDLNRLRRERRRLQQLQSERRQDILARSSPSASHTADSTAATGAGGVVAGADSDPSDDDFPLPQHPPFSGRFVWDGGADWHPSPWSKVMTSMTDTFSPAKPDQRILKTIPPFFAVSEMEKHGLLMQLLPNSQRLSTEVLKEEVLCWESATKALTAKGFLTPSFAIKVHASLTVLRRLYGYYGDDQLTDDEKDHSSHDDSSHCDASDHPNSGGSAAATQPPTRLRSFSPSGSDSRHPRPTTVLSSPAPPTIPSYSLTHPTASAAAPFSIGVPSRPSASSPSLSPSPILSSSSSSSSPNVTMSAAATVTAAATNITPNL
jgi:hypothetical protein